MFNPHDLGPPGRLRRLSLLSALIFVPNGFAVEPVVDGGAVPAESGSDPATIVNASSSGFDWSVALVVVLIGLVVLVATLDVLNAATRRARQLPAP
jgi:hypothetical protein